MPYDWFYCSGNTRATSVYRVSPGWGPCRVTRCLADPEAVADMLPPEEKAFRDTYQEKLHVLSEVFSSPNNSDTYSQPVNWPVYRDQYGGLLKSDKAAFKDLFTGILDNAPPKPQCPQIEHYFSRKYYDTLVKDVVAER
ncbi:hypothetical protein DFH08DRAFT_826846 [Mycena albidolilacea]|uniref:Uncharacterized protein n=1 Tax=Mycena albidolilacea TaxID=1033008 RepID=A0AAD7E7X9_9AGAR|nr:hypothetical protein DFH08DRAFT_826846 [Mycena albidolilacea]